MPLPLTVTCFSIIQIRFAVLVPAYPGSTRRRAVKWVCVCVCVCACKMWFWQNWKQPIGAKQQNLGWTERGHPGVQQWPRCHWEQWDLWQCDGWSLDQDGEQPGPSAQQDPRWPGRRRLCLQQRPRSQHNVFVLFYVSSSVNSTIVILDILYMMNVRVYSCLQCFDAVGWAAGRASGL